VILVHSFIHRAFTPLPTGLSTGAAIAHRWIQCEAPGLLPSAFPLRMAPDRGLRRPDVRSLRRAPSTLCACSKRQPCGQGCGWGGDTLECSCGQGGIGVCTRIKDRDPGPVPPARIAIRAVDGKQIGRFGPVCSGVLKVACTAVHGEVQRLCMVKCRCRTPAVRCPRGCFRGISASRIRRGPPKRAPSPNCVGVSRRRPHDRVAAGADVARRRAALDRHHARTAGHPRATQRAAGVAR
jgi:hypothetical protein